MILKKEYRLADAEATAEFRKESGRWHVKIEVTAENSELDHAVVSTFKLFEHILSKKPGHGYRCDCEVCKLFKERDAKRRLEE